MGARRSDGGQNDAFFGSASVRGLSTCNTTYSPACSTCVRSRVDRSQYKPHANLELQRRAPDACQEHAPAAEGDGPRQLLHPRRTPARAAAATTASSAAGPSPYLSATSTHPPRQLVRPHALLPDHLRATRLKGTCHVEVDVVVRERQVAAEHRLPGADAALPQDAHLGARDVVTRHSCFT